MVFPNVVDAVLAVRARLYIHYFMIETQEVRIERDFSRGSTLFHMGCVRLLHLNIVYTNTVCFLVPVAFP